jgi:hypothetical protein
MGKWKLEDIKNMEICGHGDRRCEDMGTWKMDIRRHGDMENGHTKTWRYGE